jgi:hypothetical protein
VNDEHGVRFAGHAALLLAALALLLYWPMLLGRVPFPADVVLQFPPYETVRDPRLPAPPHAEMGDLVTEMYPWKTHTRRSALSATLPLWNPHLLLGTTFVGDPQPALFYPPTLLYALLPTPLAWSLHFLLRTVLAGLLAALLARELGAERLAALASGVIFAFCGWVTAFQTRPHLDTVTWLALALLAIDRLRRRPTGPVIALTAAAFALPVLAGQPESAAHVTLVGLAFFLFRLALRPDGRTKGRLRFVGAFAAAGLLALGLAAVQALPTLEFIGQLDRGLDVPWGPKPLREIAAFLSRDLGATPNSAGVPIPEGAAYAGMLTLLLAPLALLHRNRRDAIFFLGLFAVALSIVYGQGPIYRLSLHTPVLRGIPNGRLLAVADLCLAVLAGLGLSALVAELRARGRARPVAWILSAAAFVGATAGVEAIRVAGRAGFQPHAFLSLRTLRGPASSAAILLAAGVLLGLALAGRAKPEHLAGIAVAFVAADLLTAGFDFIPFSRPRDIFPLTPTFEFLGRDAEPHRVAAVDGTYGPGFELVYGLDSAAAFNVIPRRTESLLGTFGTDQGVPRLLSERIVANPGRLLDLLNVKYLVATTATRSAEALAQRPDRFRPVFSDASVRVFENRTVLPRAFLVPLSGAEVLSSERAQLARLLSSDFDPARSVILPEAVPVPFRAETEPVLPPEVAGIVSGVNDVRMTAGVAEPSILVLSQTFYPGWRVEVDGAPAPLLRADYGFDGVALAPGRHRVRFALVPNSLRIGALMTAAALAVTAVLVLRGRARR